MQINQDILITYGGIAKKIKKNEYLFWEGDPAYHYYQLVEGNVKLYSTNESDKELVQGTFTDGQSFGEPPLLLGLPYPCTAQATKDSIIIRLRRETFFNILHDFPEIKENFLYTFAERIYTKASFAQIWLARTPEEKIIRILTIIKERDNLNNNCPIPYTRQEIAHFTGLRTETVIRTLRRMSEEGKIVIKKHKLFYN
ncbi:MULTISPECIES: Crp/Fnr family transcriptional regulator [Sphingobacterium]|uniref:Crp/Fnr family transcriptional regulator n=1 Tax=Sphingobacterium TaxID=28453 RepID=UPI0013D96774|nr:MULTISPECIES: Crp/Fnr family transcriptional regulator [unclassified Sphingobacterium]